MSVDSAEGVHRAAAPVVAQVTKDDSVKPPSGTQNKALVRQTQKVNAGSAAKFQTAAKNYIDRYAVVRLQSTIALVTGKELSYDYEDSDKTDAELNTIDAGLKRSFEDYKKFSHDSSKIGDEFKNHIENELGRRFASGGRDADPLTIGHDLIVELESKFGSQGNLIKYTVDQATREFIIRMRSGEQQAKFIVQDVWNKLVQDGGNDPLCGIERLDMYYKNKNLSLQTKREIKKLGLFDDIIVYTAKACLDSIPASSFEEKGRKVLDILNNPDLNDPMLSFLIDFDSQIKESIKEAVRDLAGLQRVHP